MTLLNCHVSRYCRLLPSKKANTDAQTRVIQATAVVIVIPIRRDVSAEPERIHH